MCGKISKFLPPIILAFFGAWLPREFNAAPAVWWSLAGGAAGLVLGGTIGGRLAGRLAGAARSRLEGLSLAELAAVGGGLLFGSLAALIGLALVQQIGGRLSPGWKTTGVLSLIFASIFLLRAKSGELQSFLRAGEEEASGGEPPETAAPPALKLLDTSAIIDGRIADICKTGFLEGTLLVPSFVLAELQRIADSSDSLKRNRGRRGLEILNRMQKEGGVAIKVYDQDFEDLADVDTKIVRLARLLGAKVVTNDFNLNKVAELYGVPVLNINDLSNAIKPIVLPGEEMLVHLIKDGKECGQGIGYLEDGTMVVVDGGRPHIGEDLEIMVTSVLQTSAGRMIFGKPKELARAVAQNQ